MPLIPAPTIAVNNREVIAGTGERPIAPSVYSPSTDPALSSVPAPVPRGLVKRKRDQRLRRKRRELVRTAPWLVASDKLIVPQALAKIRIASDMLFENLRPKAISARKVIRVLHSISYVVSPSRRNAWRTPSG